MHTLLLADDSITIQRVIELTFADEDIRVVVVGDGQQAIARLSSRPPDIVLADIGMPKRSGYDVAAFVKTQPALAGIPVLLLTGAFEALDEARVKDSGADGVLVKPFEPSDVIGRVKELLGIGKPRAAPAPASGRMITSNDPPAGARTSDAESGAPRATRVPPSAPAPPTADTSWEELRENSGLGSQAASVEGQSTGGDDYLDNLDAAFDSLDARLSNPGRPPEAPMPARTAPPTPVGETPVFEVEDEWFGRDVAQASREQATMGLAIPAPPPVSAAAPTPPTTPPPAASGGPAAPLEAAPADPAPPAPMAATFAGPPPSVADAFALLLADEQGESFVPVAPAATISDQLVEEVAVRVAAKLTAGGLTDEIRAIVVDTAERMVREEIRRIRGEAERRR